jgi:hypothetical protein
MRVFPTELIEKTAGGVTLTVVFLTAVLSGNQLGKNRYNLFVIRVDKGCRIHLLLILGLSFAGNRVPLGGNTFNRGTEGENARPYAKVAENTNQSPLIFQARKNRICCIVNTVLYIAGLIENRQIGKISLKKSLSDREINLLKIDLRFLKWDSSEHFPKSD